MLRKNQLFVVENDFSLQGIIDLIITMIVFSYLWSFSDSNISVKKGIDLLIKFACRFKKTKAKAIAAE